ncbi:helix-turn-helix domain-containing protein [Paenibacillus larvae]|uniref:Uncharacterized protein n=1 Tax=Paenibacillus larvae subsp. pulvifaciens TaxID=1477 RepID=A0A1U9YU76_9BACL|nr:hypothetical protein B5S25_03615 [Paenibacillus larvae subsp. pulvifaciens]ARF70557.1 hypothetical protein B7C51_17700 [Paenibacillus larvae subsp. pulvifaciens]
MDKARYSISAVAEATGYTDEKYFSKSFKKLEGLSPNQFRKKRAGGYYI